MVEKTTWVQKTVSPLATRIFSAAFLDRGSILWGIGQVARDTGETHLMTLKMSLVKHGIIQEKFGGLALDRIDHFHLGKTVTLKKLLLAAEEFYQETGVEELLKVAPHIASGRTSGTINLNHSAGSIDYRKALYAVKPRILSAINAPPADNWSWQNEMLDDAYELAARNPAAPKPELIYRMQKMADMGGDIQAIIASLFIGAGPREIESIFAESCGSRVLRFKDSVIKIVSGFDRLKNDFVFANGPSLSDRKCIFKKMCELVRSANSPQVLLLFFLYKLARAREAGSSREGIFNEIRFLYAPLAERLGLIYLADDFRDQFLRLSDPEKYKFVEARVYEQIGMNYESAKAYLQIFTKELNAELHRKLGVDLLGASVKFRVKSPYSIWNKVEVRGEYSYEGINDPLGVGISVTSEKTARAIWDILKKTDLFTISTSPGSVKEALGPAGDGWRGIKLQGRDAMGKPIEIQITTHDMHKENTCGRAATWIYNLKKDLGSIEQEFDILEPPEVVTSSFVENFYQLLNYWIA